MTFSRHFRVARAFDRVARTLEPDDMIGQRNTAYGAFGRDGRLVPGAIPANTLHLSDSVLDATGSSTSSTTVWATAASMMVYLPEGRWKVRANAMARIANSSASNVDAQLVIATDMVGADAKSGPSSGAAPMHLTGSAMVYGGEETEILVQVKSVSAGTSTMTNVVLEWFADRL